MLLAAVVALGAALVLRVQAPVRPTGPSSVRGHRVIGVGRHAIRGIDAVLGDRRFAARRVGDGWEIDGHPASPGTADALQDLADGLARLRAVDVFRARDASTYGLDRPQATIDVVTARGSRRLELGTLNASGSAVYARRAGDPRVLQVGTGLLSDVGRVLYTRDGR